jgi:hypothetical protein
MTKPPTIKDLHQHVLDLCDKHEITIYAWCRRPSQCHALTDRDEIRIVPIESRILYASALHEIGHLRGRYQRSSSTLVRERWAWEWARANALMWTPGMENSARKALRWYAQLAAWIDRPDRLKRSAHHEAGHAVIARVLGLLGGAATIVANHIFQSFGGSESYPAATIEYWHRPVLEGGNMRSLPCAYRAEVMMGMAGHEAELECLATNVVSHSGDHVDLNDIDELLLKIYPSASPAELFRHQDRLRRMTRALVRRHRDKIERVACALLQHRTLSGSAIDALLPEILAPTVAHKISEFLAQTPNAGCPRGSPRAMPTARQWRHVGHGAVMFAVGPLGNRTAAEVKIRVARIAARPAAGLWGERADFFGGSQAWVGEGGSLGARQGGLFRRRLDEEGSGRPRFGAAVCPSRDTDGGLLDLGNRHRPRG